LSEPHTADAPLSEAEKDTYVNTIKTINAKYRELEKKFVDLQESQKQTKDSVPSDQKIDAVVNKRLTDETRSLKSDFKEQIKQIRSTFDKELKKVRSRADKHLPKGLGFDELPLGTSASKSTDRSGAGFVSAMPTKGWSTVHPMTTVAVDEKDGVPLSIGGSRGAARPVSFHRQTGAGSPNKSADGKDKTKPKPVPAFTIPRNATLFSNDTMTALLGVIPVKGSVLDPIRFKLITGPQNMATNGLYIPGVANIVWSGIAIGNREMSCVRGEVYSVTFTFEDGTIRTVSTNKSTANTETSKSAKILGYISDTKGSPCIRGQLITNAEDYLTDRMLASGVAATADAYAQTQETTVASDGFVQSFFSGNSGEYIGSKALAGSLSELTNYLRERQANAVDLVFVPSGQEVVLHVEDQIELDYEPDGRRLNHAFSLSAMAGLHSNLD
jgi:integrating conjugative element protein (TIGR03752 family)